MINYISLLGWNPKTTEEIFSLSELIKRFKLEDVHKAGAVFDEERMEWFNAKYIAQYSPETLWNKIKTYLRRYDSEYLEQISHFDEKFHFKVLSELQTRMKRLSEFRVITGFLYGDTQELTTDLFLNQKMKIESLADVKKSLELSLELLKNREITLDTPDEIKEAFIQEIQKHAMKNGQVLWPVRVALSMEQFSP